MSLRLAVAAITATLALIACGPTPPTAAPAATGHSTATASGPSSPSTQPASPPASGTPPADVLPRISDPGYLAGNVFTLLVGDAGADWIAPPAVPVMPDGRPAARVAFLPASCAVGNFTIAADPAPEDAWETTLRADGDEHQYTLGSWPAAQLPECADGQVRTYLQVAYHPFAPSSAIHLVAALTTVTDTTAVQVLPVFTSADASQPALISTGFIALEPVSGPEKPRSAKVEEISASDFGRTTLPDGTTPTQWGYQVTGCGPVGRTPITITARVGNGVPVEVGSCSDGSFQSAEMSLPLPADGTRVALLMAGGTTRAQVRVSEFQWRGDRP